MSRDSLIDAYIELKKKILVTDANNHQYEALFKRLRTIDSSIFKTHEILIMNAELKFRTWEISELLMQKTHHDAQGMIYTEFTINNNLDLPKFDSELLLYISFFLHHGGHIQYLGKISENQEKMLEILDYLITQRNYYPAYFFKGFVYKYGVKVYSKPKLAEAKKLLEVAMANGVGSAKLELQDIEKLQILENIKPVNRIGDERDGF